MKFLSLNLTQKLPICVCKHACKYSFETFETKIYMDINIQICMDIFKNLVFSNPSFVGVSRNNSFIHTSHHADLAF